VSATRGSEETGGRQGAGPWVRKIIVRVTTGQDRMSGTDDPIFLRLMGPGGREFRLDTPRGRGFRRDSLTTFVLAGGDDPEAHLERPEMNDPTSPRLPMSGIEGVGLRKDLNPIPNVRGMAELDDRILIADVEVEIHPDDDSSSQLYRRGGPIWLGLVCGLFLELEGPRVGT
jgi:hypothetical protein